MKNGQQAPDFRLADVDGKVYHLADIRAESRAVVLLFLRHLG
ncbi:MAG: hypothetical protein ACLFTK_03200 [Anaerolineales bacterium]